ncbi:MULTISPECIES: APC family permease [unclassified Streptomyces]|uniref:APC family permease n=1 Tax=unclassified Streptomyces TaxID=2593676 RepID=UPI0001C197EC|nr:MULTISPECIES: APC family permease [unclassified Streptomyces]AEN11757.1 putative integral membrane protein [Streptomyces sp. SirexAA-E]PZX40245.1 amino acid transporter [Streptomyces sp. DvalAA-21]RAJ36412.1 amino acid transporter [Streptomyces sp. DpondAA-E10]RAJ50378.1 amino acid transporter [Streptomyces sp. DpondAA-A50]SCD35975.1 amino acid/polyamine/organocation transporter, APC superfamily [Streptomyces sp. DpondAA-F4a]
MSLDRPVYRVKNRLLGKALTSEHLSDEKLSNRTALGVLASDCVSSSAYGSEQMLRVLVPAVGVAGFTLLMPVTGAILLVLVLLTLCYSDVVMIYTRAGGSYVVARENFGPDVAQVAAVALLVDYVVTVAVQVSAGTNALISLAHLAGGGWTGMDRFQLPLSVAAVVLLAYGNLRGVREAGRIFALPAYLFMAAIGLVVVVSAVRGLLGDLPHADLRAVGVVPLGTGGDGWLYGASLFIVLRAFANGGSSLTGLEAISNGISAFREPQGRNARRTMIVMSCVLGFLVLGVSTLAHVTHAVPYTDGTPTVIAQEAHLAFGGGPLGTIGLVFVQLATALVLYTGANTPFTGFPFLASFVAQDRFLPRVLTRRGHRLAFSNGIICLAVVSLALLLATRASVDKLVALYAIGVFTAFTMAGAGLAAYHLRRREPHRRKKIAVNALASVISAAVVVIFAITKFTEGAWLVVVVFPLGVWALTRINREYRREAAALEGIQPSGADRPPTHRHVVFVLVQRLDLATLKALRYAHELRPDGIRAVHFAIDEPYAERLADRWSDTSATSVPLDVVACPDRRLHHAMAELAARTTRDGDTSLTVLVPRRLYRHVLGKLLHRGTGEGMAKVLGTLPHVAVTILPFDVSRALHVLEEGKEPQPD